MFRRTASRALLALALSVSLAACGEADDQDGSGASGTTSATSAPTSAAPSEQPCEEQPATVEPQGIPADLAQKPTIPASDAPPPCGLVIGDVVVGTGPEAV